MTRFRFLLLALPLLAAACSDDNAANAPAGGADPTLAPTSAPASTPTSAPAATGPCGLLTLEEVSTAMRTPIRDGIESDASAGAFCTWQSTEAPSEGLDSPIHLNLLVAPYEGEAVTAIEAMAADPTENVVVEGLGDLAVAHCSFGTTEKCDELFVVVGQQYVELAVGNYAYPADYEESDMIGIVTALAELAVSRLP